MVDAWGVSFDLLNSCELLEQYLLDAAEKSGATVITSKIRKFEPQGISAFVLLAESHISIHTYPEKGFAAIDCYTCGEAVDPTRAVQYLIEQLKPTQTHSKLLQRGIGRIEVMEEMVF